MTFQRTLDPRLHRSRRATLALLLSLASGGPAWSSSASPSPSPAASASASPATTTATQRETARAWWMEGLRLFDQKKYDAALERFTAAYNLVRVPTVGIEMARTQEAMGKWVEANAAAIDVINMPVAPDEPQVFAEARARAQKLRARLTPLIPSLRVDVTPAETTVLVEIDGEPMTVPGQELSFRLNPGGHELLVSAPGYLSARRTVVLRQQERQTVSIALVPDSSAAAPSAAAPSTAAPSTAAPSTAAEPSADGLFGGGGPTADQARPAGVPSTLGYIALGTAGVAALTAGITGTLAFTSKPSCPGSRCRPDQRDDADASLRYGNVATVSFGVALAAGAYGLWELLAASPTESAARGKLPASASLTPLSSGALLELSGSF